VIVLFYLDNGSGGGLATSRVSASMSVVTLWMAQEYRYFTDSGNEKESFD